MFKLANKRSRTHAVRRKSLAAELSVSPGFCSPGFQRKACCLPTPKLRAGVVAATGTGVCAVRVSDTILLGAGFSACCGGGSAFEIIRHLPELPPSL